MFMIGPVGFAIPWLLLALIALPILWFLLRAVPPAPIRRRFPGVALLLGLKDEESETDKTPWWLLLLRMLAVAAAIIGFAGPILNPDVRGGGSGPLLVAVDGSWADARDWPRRAEKVEALVEEAGAEGRAVALIRLTDVPEAVQFQTAEAWAGRAAGLQPQAWAPAGFAQWAAVLPDGGFETVWLSDGLAHPGREDLLVALEAMGPVRVIESPRPVLGLHPAGFDEGRVVVAASRMPAADAVAVEVIARGPDPAGIERELARVTLPFAAGEARAEAMLDVPPELRNRITRFELEAARTAGAVSLADDSLKRRKIALIGAGPDQEALQLLSPLHYLRQALEPVAEIIDGSLTEVLLANPDVVILADVARLTQTETDATLDWLEEGGLLLRFAGPRLAASDVSRFEEDPLLPVRLREGGRTVGGTMSWGEPKALAPFTEGSPFFGLVAPDDVVVRGQVLAQPGPELAERTIAALDDGTPLVTRKVVGDGQVVLVHVTANAEWSSLPLSGLFVQMLERLAVSTRPALPEAADLAGQVWSPEVVLDAYGQLSDAGELPGAEGEALAGAITGGPTLAMPPGLYAGADRRVALNVMGPETELLPAVWPASVPVEGLEGREAQALKGAFLTAGLALLLIDVLAALWVAGRLSGLRRGAAVLLVALVPAGEARAQDTSLPNDALALQATTAVVLAHVLTGDAQVDQIATAGLTGLGNQLWQRTSVEPQLPIGVDIERDELAFFPFLYWPITAGQAQPSPEAYEKLNRYLRTGGMILFDTRDADVAGFGGATPEGKALQVIASGLDIPPLEQMPGDHVLTRTFYLLQEFPGRYARGPIWVEAAPMAAAEAAEGMPFRNLNDGVTPVVIGGNDWAAAWAVDDIGVPLLPVGRGFAGERQREIAYRFGINLIMYVLTGNYKSDQVHVPALLERLGQ
ncbi:MAG: LytTR family transcriptional regulator [Rhodobacter sp.]|nr:LytTR family transcriptional regulator [Rhodobacter sp.]